MDEKSFTTNIEHNDRNLEVTVFYDDSSDVQIMSVEAYGRDLLGELEDDVINDLYKETLANTRTRPSEDREYLFGYEEDQ